MLPSSTACWRCLCLVVTREISTGDSLLTSFVFGCCTWDFNRWHSLLTSFVFGHHTWDFNRWHSLLTSLTCVIVIILKIYLCLRRCSLTSLWLWILFIVINDSDDKLMYLVHCWRALVRWRFSLVVMHWLDQLSYSTLGPVSAWMGDRLRAGKLSWYVTSHPGQLSLAIPLWVGTMSTSLCWEGNYRSDVALAMHHRQYWFIHLRAQWPMKGR